MGKDTAEIAAYRVVREAIAARLAIVAPDPGAPSDELRALATYLIAAGDSQVGLGAAPPALILAGVYMSFDDALRRCALLSSQEWQSGALPHRLVELANAVAAA